MKVHDGACSRILEFPGREPRQEKPDGVFERLKRAEKVVVS